MSTIIDKTSTDDLADRMTTFVENQGDTPTYISTVIDNFMQKERDEQDVRLTILELIASHRIILGPELQLTVGE